MVSFTGKCLVHRAEIMQLHCAWPDAIIEARRGDERLEKGIDPQCPTPSCKVLQPAASMIMIPSAGKASVRSAALFIAFP